MGPVVDDTAASDNEHNGVDPSAGARAVHLGPPTTSTPALLPSLMPQYPAMAQQLPTTNALFTQHHPRGEHGGDISAPVPPRDGGMITTHDV